jgi:hypothetical protein
MEFTFKITRSLQNIRISVVAAQLVNTGNYENVKREVGLEGDVLDCQGDTDAVRNDRLKECFDSMRYAVVSMLAVTIGEGVPENHELASPDRKATYKERIERERKADKERREKDLAARKARNEAEREYEEVCAACAECKAKYESGDRDAMTGARLRRCDKHVQGWDLLIATFKTEETNEDPW